MNQLFPVCLIQAILLLHFQLYLCDTAEEECHEPLACTPFKECSSRIKGHVIPHSEVLFSCSSKNGEIYVCCPAVESLENFDSTEIYNPPRKIQDDSNDSIRYGPVGGGEHIPRGTNSRRITKSPLENSESKVPSEIDSESFSKLPFEQPGMPSQIEMDFENTTHRHTFTADSRNPSHVKSATNLPIKQDDSAVLFPHESSLHIPMKQSENKNRTCNESYHLRDFQKNPPFHRNMYLLPAEDCGVQNANRIINGQNASLGQFPWMALLGYRLNDGHIYYLCGGSLINRRYVLTAAHCLKIKGATIQTVRLGEHDQLSDDDCDDFEGYCADPVLELRVQKSIPHVNYNNPRLKNDIALLRLDPQIPQYTDYIRPICLPFGIIVTGFEDRIYTVAGWGKLHNDDDFGSQFLQFVRIHSNSLDDCDARQAKEVRPLDSTQLCAGRDEGKDVCRGDSGGPLMDILQSPTLCKMRTYQIGITSFGSVPCGAEYTPSVYTRVSAFLDWVLDHMEP